jgi:hypothetical protein
MRPIEVQRVGRFRGTLRLVEVKYSTQRLRRLSVFNVVSDRERFSSQKSSESNSGLDDSQVSPVLSVVCGIAQGGLVHVEY